ncbi:MAG TPA: ribonuclease E/G, partial [Xylella taiwanensis]
MTEPKSAAKTEIKTKTEIEMQQSSHEDAANSDGSNRRRRGRRGGRRRRRNTSPRNEINTASESNTTKLSNDTEIDNVGNIEPRQVMYRAIQGNQHQPEFEFDDEVPEAPIAASLRSATSAAKDGISATLEITDPQGIMETASQTNVASQMASQAESSAASVTSYTSPKTTTHTHKDAVSDPAPGPTYKARTNTMRSSSGSRLETFSATDAPTKVPPSVYTTPAPRSNVNTKATKTEIPNGQTNADTDTAPRPIATDALAVTAQPVMAIIPSTTITTAQTKAVPATTYNNEQIETTHKVITRENETAQLLRKPRMSMQTPLPEVLAPSEDETQAPFVGNITRPSEIANTTTTSQNDKSLVHT